ncbi:Alpha/Beta hydrolase protein [Xylaria palmicola]|nr:Alpha/Beta hydrolase protein [Xylaria palmicola]
MHRLFPRSGFFDFETVRILGTTAYGGADVAEVLEAVGEIKSDNPISWEDAWRKQAQRAEKLAEEARQHGDRDAALRGYLRASNYTRASGYMYVSSLNEDGDLEQDPRALPIAEKVGQLFHKAMPLMEGEVPILVNTGGADSCQEELFYVNPVAGPGMGYAVLTFDGPGQGIMLRKYELEMRPDWETVTSSVINYLESYSARHPDLELDLGCIGVSGTSMGEYYALRVASDDRVKACVSIDPFYDMWNFGTAHVSLDLRHYQCRVCG